MTPQIPALMSLEGVGHRYPSSTNPLPALNHVSLDVAADGITAVVGESGCGKTTLGRIVSGLVKPSEGQVSFENHDVWRLEKKAWNDYRRRVQVIQQDPYASLNPGLNVADILRPGLLRHHIVPRRQVRDEIVRLLDLVGLESDTAFLHRFPHQLSGGQRQRLGVARAVSLRPDLIVADEPSSMLDVSIRVAVLDLMLSLQAERQLAYLFISHDFGVVRYMARNGRIVVMFFGEVVEEGPTEEIIGRPRHPYSYQLLEAIPIPDPRVVRRRRAETVAADLDDRLEQPPSPDGCIYTNRCPFAEDICRRKRPELTEQAGGHRVACWFPERVPPLPLTPKADIASTSRSDTDPDKGKPLVEAR